MATYTSYLNLEKPAVGETFNLLKINQNWDKIDQGVSALNSNMPNVYKVEKTINTGAYGRFQTGVYVGSGQYVVAIISKTTPQDQLVYIDVGYYNTQYWGFARNVNNQALLNTDLDIIIIYVFNTKTTS